MQFDAEDTILIGLVAFASAVMAGVGSFSAFGVSLADTTTIAGGTFSLAYLGTAAAFVATVVTNDGMSLDPRELSETAEAELSQLYYYLLMASLVLLVLWPFVTEIPTFVQSTDLWGVLFIAGSVGAQVAMGYLK
jgi:hypothetical protein